MVHITYLPIIAKNAILPIQVLQQRVRIIFSPVLVWVSQMVKRNLSGWLCPFFSKYFWLLEKYTFAHFLAKCLHLSKKTYHFPKGCTNEISFKVSFFHFEFSMLYFSLFSFFVFISSDRSSLRDDALNRYIYR